LYINPSPSITVGIENDQSKRNSKRGEGKVISLPWT